ncbi:SCP2 sterol-binding domain-containing protein [Nocardia sp. NBC_00565]|uniref:SCP2 sterol-binding domain-containing protein n=1 Tax=Nocardia sp. NBC_00565 TaxID=2975993 RepID=UPI002E819FDC|nr:SCP2 sterol-binding domain-containing protein [Nocardia sp. NBC_00565]WUC00880.1 SCP2 sterol-binding domain-containing protein [Nocardia sp. NBC_00565]
MYDITEIDPAQVSPGEFKNLIASTSDEKLRAALADPNIRNTMLDTVFARMPDRLSVDEARGVDATVLWRVGQTPDEWLVTIRDGGCTVTKATAGVKPTVSLTLGDVLFLRLLSGQASGTKSMLSGKLRVKGDVLFARRVEKLFSTD